MIRSGQWRQRFSVRVVLCVSKIVMELLHAFRKKWVQTCSVQYTCTPLICGTGKTIKTKETLQSHYANHFAPSESSRFSECDGIIMHITQTTFILQ